VKIVELARDLITLSGFRPDIDIDVKFSGVRPGEKLFEELSTDAESADKTKHPKIFIGRVRSLAWDDALRGIELLAQLALEANPDEIRVALAELIPEYTPTAGTPAPIEANQDPTREAPSATEPKGSRRGTNGTDAIVAVS